MKKHSIKYIIFDLGGVLVNIHPDRAMQSLTDATPFSTEEVQRFFLSKAHIRLMSGKISFREFFDIFRNEYSFSKSYQNFLDIWESIIGDPEYRMESLVRRLSESYSIVLCSNTDPEHWRVCRERCCFLEPYFSKCFLSYKMGLVKPDSAIYQMMLDNLSASADSAVFIDDSIENIDSASAIGLHAIHATSFREITAGLEDIDIKY